MNHNLPIKPGPGQESVWDYPRPPRIEASKKVIKVVYNDLVIAESRGAKRVLETSHPPVYYIPPGDIEMDHLIPEPHQSWCEWKGRSSYYTLSVSGKRTPRAAWGYSEPTRTFESIRGHIAFYPHLMDYCTVDGERVRAQAGGFYGGWITRDIVGPFKGEPGTHGW
jgi:uncharacterized protein (DUF427 family)